MKYRYGLIGLGKHGRGAVAPVFYDPACIGGELVAVCDAAPSAVDAFDLPVESRYTTSDSMLGDPNIDVVYIAVGMDRHRDIAIKALESGKHVLVEKPMAATPEQCREMIDAAAASKRELAVNFESRFSEQNAVIRRWIGEGRLGNIEALHFANMWDGHKSFGPVKERRARLMELAGALDCGIHKLDQARFIAGGGWADIHARGAWMGEDFTPPTHIGIVGQLDSGVLVTLNASLSWAAHIEQRPMVNTLEIAGTEGVVLCRSTPDFRSMTVNLYSAHGDDSVSIDASGHTNEIILVVNEFANVIEHGRNDDTALATGEDGYWAQWAMNTANEQAVAARIET